MSPQLNYIPAVCPHPTLFVSMKAQPSAISLFFLILTHPKGKPNTGQEQPGDSVTEVPFREPEVKEKGDPEQQNEVEEEEDDEDEDEDEDERQLLGEFEKELEGILLPSDRERPGRR